MGLNPPPGGAPGARDRAPRRPTRVVRVGRVAIGGDEPVAVQTMWKDRLERAGDAEIEKLRGLELSGCEILRFAVPTVEDAEILGALAGMTSLPLVADIHFDHRIALRCLDFPIAKLRINPGNIGSTDKVRELARKAADKGVPIRIGVNYASIPKDLRALDDRPEAMVAAAAREIAVLEELSFSAIVVSLKSSDVETTLEAARLFAARYDYPQHVGLTEAGPLVGGLVRSAAALVPLLAGGIGDTIRVSLSAPEATELIAAREILAAAGRGRALPRIVSCPRCGRNGFDVHAFLDRNLGYIYSTGKEFTVAVMGCAVNGPGEALDADLGITGGGGKALIFRRGKIVRTLALEDADKAFREELDSL